ncbi:DUF1285 domain-containing protein [Shewanella sp. VB17]|uniref:DUF1285 domain-containing protein n=1 Tax=Shewanella sp. VB17 TaxID=2739432 RepID=UPI001567AC02|nr:DUF1285 domain-containing protein [Shewanella sp. VB17]NRD73777.1 DUF1285 domain-containing protein [Shewanella sp. VB17]
MSDNNTLIQQHLARLDKRAELCSEDVLFKIDAQGDWFYVDEILPVKFARLFASILNNINGEYFLITPVEKLKVKVSGHALSIVDYHCFEAGGIEVTTSLQTRHKLVDVAAFNVNDEEIYAVVERGMTAKLGRACYYRFINEFMVDDY